MEESTEDAERDIIRRAAGGGGDAWNELTRRYRERLRRMVVLRLDARLKGRVDPSDVLQDVFVEVVDQLAAYLRESTLPFYLWLRLKTGDRVSRLHRHHLGTQSRDAAREVSLFHGPMPEASSMMLAEHLAGVAGDQIDQSVRAEQTVLLNGAILELDPLDREVLVLRHFEQLTTAETAQVLGISASAAAKRYFRALARLKTKLTFLHGADQF
jgi:RNA polymerase sigma-70 factor (ECF subfamily)